MRIRDLKALARETLLKWYGSVIIARFFQKILVALVILIGLVFFGLGILNVNEFPDWLWIFFPDFKQSGVAAVIFFLLFFASMLFSVLLDVWTTFGYQKMLLNICRGEKASSGNILSQFKKTSRPWKVLWTCILRTVFTFIILILPLFTAGCAIVCGYDMNTALWYDPWHIAIKSLQIISVFWIVFMSIGFSFAETVVIDRPETSAIDALKLSLAKVTEKRKFKLVGLVLSFILWMILAACVPFASLFIMPYLETTLILYYLDGCGELDRLPAYRELLRSREEARKKEEAAKAEKEAAEAAGQADAAKEQSINPEGPADAAPEVQPAAEPAANEADPAALTAADFAEEEKPVEMASIPKKIAFPDIDADPNNMAVPNNQPAQSGTEE